MGDASHYTDTILQAIEVISDSKVKNANYDRTVRAEIKKCTDEAIGQYRISYEGIEQTAYASDPKMKYEKGQGVYVLIPSNNTQRVKTIINTIDHLVTTSDGVKQTGDLYNEMGPNALVPIDQNIVELCSYKEEDINLLEYFNLSDDYIKYLKNSNGLIIKGTLQTKLPLEQQVYGQYGIKVVCRFKKNGNQNEEITKEYTLSNLNVIGYPYTITEQTQIYSLQEFDGQNFIGIESISAFCSGFPKKEQEKPSDIFISNIQLQGAGLLNISNNDGYTVFINYSANGDTINNDIPQILLKGELKLQGTIITDKVEYYWFKQNGTVFKGNDKYSSYGGDGWECLNNKDGKSFIGAKTNKFYFCGSETDKGKIPSTVLDSKFYTIKCVAVYNGVKKVEGKGKVYNQNITNSLAVLSSDGSSVDYYFGNGSPTLRCVYLDENNNQTIVGDHFIWTIEYKDGTTEKVETAAGDLSAYLSAKEAYQSFQKEYKKVAKNDKKAYYTANEYKVDNWNGVKSLQIANGNLLQNVNIDAIKDWAKITCGVEKNGAYIGTASITLYNHMEIKGQYSVNIINGTQVFQYDDDGISPCASVKQSPLQIKPLQVALLDNEGRRIDFEQIKGNGKIYWCIPKTDTLLLPKDIKTQVPQDFNTSYGTVKALAANNTYSVYKNLQTFSYSIADIFDYSKKENDIRLYIEYKDMVFDVYTNFTFPKSGDPGTNGTKYYAKIQPGLIYIKKNNKKECIPYESPSDRVYIDNNGHGYDDQGRDIDSFKATLYNGSTDTNISVNFWSCPLNSAISAGNDRFANTHFAFSKKDHINNSISVSLSSDSTLSNDAAVDILRAQFGTGQNPKYFAEIPICYVFSNTNNGGNSNFRIKVKPKTGYNYVVYAEDGTHPDYGKSNTFEIILEKLQKEYYVEQSPETYTCVWQPIGNFKEIEYSHKAPNNIVTVNPMDSFDGSNIDNKIKVTIGKNYIYIPIYMLINRYGHAAINDWDGNSIELGGDGGTILAPQVGAGKKDNNNNFTGLLMGQVKYNPNATTSEVGLFGYDRGQRTIFLDAQSGKAQFGKNNAGKIIIDPSQKMNDKDVALLYSSNFNATSYIEKNGQLKKGSSYINYQKSPGQGGMMIDLTTPQIAFANGKFNVDSQGNLHSETGDIGGWQITANTLQSTNSKGGVILSSDNSTETNKAILTYTKNNNSTKNIFSVDYRGHLHSEAGDIAGWNISPESLSKNNVGMNSSTDTTNNDYKAGTKTKAFFANGDNFYVTHDGYLKSQSGKIANWKISEDALTDGRTGMGTTIAAPISNITGINNDTDDLNFWAGNSSGLNFAVSTAGRLYSKLGLIGGWHIDGDMLYTGKKYGQGKGIRLNAEGSIQGGGKASTYHNDNGNEYYEYSDGSTSASKESYWTINESGDAVFNNIYASEGKIGNWTIGDGAIKGLGSSVSLNKDGTITANNGQIGGCQIYNGGIKSGSNWQITSGGDAIFNNLYGNIKSGQSLTGSGMSLGGGGGTGSWVYPDSISTPGYGPEGNDGDSLKKYIEDTSFSKIKASTGIFENLLADGFTLNGEQIKIREITFISNITSNGYTKRTMKVLATSGSEDSGSWTGPQA